MKSPITTHVLDLMLGRPATGITVILESQTGETWRELGKGVTNADGRVADLLPEDIKVVSGPYRLTFYTSEYFARMQVDCFYPRVLVEFTVASGSHYHVPLLLSPYGYSTYRGS